MNKEKVIIKKFISIFVLAISLAYANCNDGIDDDSDGLTDWQLDLGCFGPEDADERALGYHQERNWTTYDPAPGARIIYVSSSEGNDAWSGLRPYPTGSDGPKKTAAAGKALLGKASSDWLLFRRGDVWRDEALGQFRHYNGLSREYPIVIASYGVSKERPRFEHSTSWLNLDANISNISILGLHAYAYARDPNNPYFSGKHYGGISWLAKGGDFLLEDCKLEYSQMNIQDYEGKSVHNFTLRRNILTHSYSLNSHAQSIFTHTAAPMLFEENIFNHGGWNNDFRLALWSPESRVEAWRAVSNGFLDLNMHGQSMLLQLDFSTVNSMDAAAQKIEDAINQRLTTGTVSLEWTLGKAFILKSSLPSSSNYRINHYTGMGTDVGRQLLNATDGSASTNQGAPESTIFNRNRYLSGGKGNTILRGNIDANGASGGVQLREGGMIQNELFINNPISISMGHTQNSAYNTTGRVVDNVVLGNRDIDTQTIGVGVYIESMQASGTYGPSWVVNTEVTGNIIAHSGSSTGNIRGLYFGGNAPFVNVDVHDNIVYDWTHPSWQNANDHRAYGAMLYVNQDSRDFIFRNNVIQQPDSGFAATAPETAAGAISLSGNTYFTAEPDPPIIWSRGWFDIGGSASKNEWVQQMGEDNPVFERAELPDPSRNLEGYMASIGETATYDAFISKALSQSKYDWDDRFTANSVNGWIRQGFFREGIQSCLSMSELGQRIVRWRAGTITMTQLMQAINEWKGCI